MKGLKRKFRRGFAGFLAFVLTMTSFNMVSWADVAEAFEKENATFIMSGEDLRESAQAAIDEGNEFYFEDLGVGSSDRSLVKDYEKLFTNGSVYEIAPTYEMDEEESADGAELRLFVRVNDAYEGYQLTGDEEIIFLYVNDSESRVTFRSLIDGYYTKKVTVKGNSTIFETSVPAAGGNAGGNAGGSGAAGAAGENQKPEETVGEGTTAAPEETVGEEGTTAAPEEIAGEEGTTAAPEEMTGEEGTTAAPEEMTGEEGTTAAPEEVTGEEGTTAAPEEGTTAAPEEVTGEEGTTAAPEETTGEKAADPKETTGNNETVTTPDESEPKTEEAGTTDNQPSSDDKGSTDTQEEKSASDSSNTEGSSVEPVEEKTEVSISRNRTHILTTADSEIQDVKSEDTAEDTTDAADEAQEDKKDDVADVPSDNQVESKEDQTQAVSEETEETGAEEEQTDVTKAAENEGSKENTTEEENKESAAAPADESTAVSDETAANEESSENETGAPANDTAASDDEKNGTENGNEEQGGSFAGNGSGSNSGSDNGPAADPSVDETEEEEDAVKGTTSGKTYGQVVLDESYYAKAYVTTLNKLHVDVSESGYAVTYTVTPVGTATVTGAKSVVEGKDLTFTVKPQVGYVVESVTANGESLEADEDVASDSEADTRAKHFTVSEVMEEQEIVVSMAETGEHPEFNFSKTLGDVVVSLHAEEGILPAGTVAKVVEVTEKVEEAVKEKTAEETGEDTSENTVLAYDIKLYVENEDGELEELDNSWSESGYVEVTFTGKAIEEKSAEAETIEISHVDIGNVDATSEEVEKVAVEEVQNIESVAETVDVSGENAVSEVGFEAQHFSTYAIIFAGKTEVKATIYTVDMSGINIGNSNYDAENNPGNKYTFQKNETKDIRNGIVPSVKVPEGYTFKFATAGENKNDPRIIKLKRKDNNLYYLGEGKKDSSGNYKKVSGNKIKLWYDSTISVKIYSRYNGLLDYGELNKDQDQGNFGPQGNNTPYITVDIDLNALLSKLGQVYSGYKVVNKNSYKYISVNNESITKPVGDKYKQTVKDFYQYIYEFIDNTSKNNMGEVLGDQYYGYVLKKEGDGWHLDGFFDNEYTLEIYYANEGISQAEHSHSTDKAEKYGYVTEYIEKKLGASIEWGKINTADKTQTGNYTDSNGIPYKVNITFGTAEYPTTVTSANNDIGYYKLSNSNYGEKNLAIFTYSVVKAVDDEPDTPAILVKKIFNGLGESEIALLNHDEFKVKLNHGDEQDVVNLNTGDGYMSDDLQYTHIWNINNLNAGTYQVSEEGASYPNYEVTTTYNGSPNGNSVTTARAEMEFNDIKQTTPSELQDYKVGKVDLIVAKLTGDKGTNSKDLFVWTTDKLTGSGREAVIQQINKTEGFNNSASEDNCYFFSGDNITDQDGLTFRSATLKYDGNNIMHFELPSQWAMFFTANYTIKNPDRAEITIVNTYTRDKGSLMIQKSLAEDSEKVTIPDDTTFTVYQRLSDGKNVEYATFKYKDMLNGSKILNNVPTGAYYVVESNNNIPSYDCTVVGANETAEVIKGKTATIKLINKYVRHTGSIKITKKVTVNGKTTTGNLADGIYSFALYDADGENRVEGQDVKSVTITGGISNSVAFDSVPVGDYTVFEVIQNSDGSIRKGSPEGMSVTPGYHHVTVQKDSQATVEFTNNKVVTGSVSIEKLNKDGELLKGAEFTLYIKGNKDYTPVSNENNGVYTTDDNGKIVVNELPFGDYRLVETKAPTGYQLSTSAWSEDFTIGDQDNQQSHNFKVENEKVQGYAKITKTFSDKKQLTEDEKKALKEVKIGVYSENASEPIMETAPDADGVVIVGPLEYGTYYFKEISAPGSYLLNGDSFRFSIESSNDESNPVDAGTIENTRVKASVSFKKLEAVDDDTKKPLAGAIFELYRKNAESSGSDTKVGTEYKSNQDGVVTASDLETGTYYFIEKKLDGYQMNDTEYYFQVTRDDHGKTITNLHEGSLEGSIVTEVVNTRSLGEISIEKVDEDKNPLTGAEFTLYAKKAEKSGALSKLVKAVKNFVGVDDTYEIYGTGPYAVDENGKLTISELPWNDYILVETKAPQGYNLSSAEYSFTISARNLNPELGDEGKITNTKKTGSVQLLKTDDRAEKAIPLADAEFELYRISADGTDKDEKIGGSYTTDQAGKTVVINNLKWGTYYFKEIKAPENYILPSGDDANTEPFTINADTVDKTQEIVKKNTLITGNLKLTKYFDGKTVAEAIRDNVITAQEAAQVSFNVYKQTGEEPNINRDELLTQSPIQLTTDGTVEFGPLVIGKYYVKEVTAPNAYPIKDRLYSFEITRDNYAVNNGIVEVTVDNTKITKDVTFKKVDADNNQAPISGAQFELYKSKAGAYEKYGNSYSSNESGIVKFEGLGVGEYYFVETSNSGYVVPETQYYFEISQNTGDKVEIHESSLTGNIVTDSIISNSRKTATVVLTKVDRADREKTLQGAEFSLYRKVDGSADETIAEKLTTDEYGKISREGLTWGSYYFVETKAPEGYKLNADPIDFVVDRSTSDTGIKLSAVNDKYYANVELAKVFKQVNGVNDNTAAGNLEAVFALYKVVSGEEGDILIDSGLTTKDGKVTYQKLETGNYYFVETSAPEGYSIELDGEEAKKYPFEVAVPNDNESVTINAGTAVNTQIAGSVEVEKLDGSHDNAPMGNVSFEVYKKGSILGLLDSKIKRVIVTNANGTGSLSGLEWGNYYLKEITPEGYVVNNTKYDFTISADNLKASFTAGKAIYNTAIKGSVTLTKKDKTSGEVLQGVTFDLYKGTSPNGVLENTNPLITDENGQITVDNLEYGSYYFKEKEAKAGYQLSASVVDFKIEENGKSVLVEAENERIAGSIEITKEDGAAQGLAGAEFTLYSKTDRREMNPIARLISGNSDYYEYRTGLTTGAEGKLNIENLPWDDYYLIETKAPQGYELNGTTKYSFTIGAENLKGQLANVTDNIIANKAQTGSVTLTKTDADDGKVLAGAEFDLYRVGAGAEGSDTLISGGHVTDEKGKVTVSGLSWGTYYFVETKAPEGYDIPAGDSNKSTPATIDASNANSSNLMQSQPVTLTNHKIRGAVKLTKVFKDGETTITDAAQLEALNSAVRFALYKEVAGTDQGTLVPDTIELGADGTVIVSDLEYGNYYFIETESPAEYPVNSARHSFAITESSTVEKPIVATVQVDNAKVYSSASITKVDGNNGAPVEGAVFGLYDGAGKLLRQIRSDEQGVVKAEGLGVGTYYFQEISNTGYAVAEMPMKYYFEITKESDAEVSVHENSLGGAIVTQVTNNRLKGSITITKSGDDTTEKLDGAVFELYAGSDRENAIATKTTANGQVTFGDLAWGTYYAVETKAPDGYVLAEKAADRTYEFVIDREHIELNQEVTNTRIKGSVILRKKDAADEKVSLDNAKFNLYQADGMLVQSDLTTVSGTFTVDNLVAGNYYFVETVAPEGYKVQMENGSAKKYDFTIDQASIAKPVEISVSDDRILGTAIIYKTDSENGTGLEGAVFELSRMESALFGFIENKAPVNTYKTDSNGRLEIQNLAWGTYELKETQAPDGYKITDGTVKRFTIDADHLWYGGDEAQDKIVFTNDRLTGSIQLVKKDQEENAVEGAEFELYRKNTAETAGDTRIPNAANGKGTYTTDQSGQITVSDLSWGTYYFVEVSAPEGYAIANKKTGEVTIQASNVAESIKNPLVVEVVNTKIYGNVTLTKEGENGEKLAGAEFDLYSYTKAADGSVTNPVLRSHHAVSNEGADTGTLKVEKLPYGDYYFKETKAPDNYNLSEEELFFAITTNGEQLELLFVNTLIKANVSFQKVDATDDETTGLNGAVFGLYKSAAEGNDVFVGDYTSQTVEAVKGVVLAKGLGAGKYYFVEKTAPAGYELDSTSRYEFSITAEDNGDTIALPSVSNVRKTGSVVLTKYMSGTDSTLKGAVYNLYRMTGVNPNVEEDTIIGQNMVTGAEGTISADQLAWGEYYFVEQSAPTGYTMDQTPIRFTVNESTDFANAIQVRGENNRIAGTVNIEKVSSEDNTEKIEDVQFELRLQGQKDVAATLITNAEGKATADNLAWGIYTLTEKQTAPGFIPWSADESRTITIDAEHLTINLTGEAAITNDPIRGNVKVVKKDAEDQNKLLAGAEFEIYRTGDDAAAVGTLITNEQGEAVSDSLRYGAYYLLETKAPTGYELPAGTAFENRIEFTISENGETVDIPVLNKRQPGSADAVKTDKNGNLLEGAVFTLYSSKDHHGSGLTAAIRAALNDGYYEYGTYVTDPNGQINMDNLPWDTYYLRETTAPTGYALSDAAYPFTINETHLAVNVGNIENTALKGSVQLTKTAAGEENQPLSGAEFALFRNLGDGTSEKVELDQALLTTNASGIINLTDLAWGEYYFKEVKAPTGYALNPAEVGFTITRDNVAASIEAPIGVTVTDTAFEIGVDKVDAETKDSLTGAELKVYRLEDVAAGKPIEGAVPVAEWNSIAGSPQDIGKLVNGGDQYVLIETKAPAGYTVAENLVFTVRSDGTIETEGIVAEGNIILLQDVKYMPGTLTITAGKELTGRSMKDGEFEFALRDGDNTIATAVNRADGSVTFNLMDYYKEVGEYDYTAVEINNGLSGVTYDEQSYAVHVSVTDNSEGGLAVNVTYPNDGESIVFKNAYHADGSLMVAGTKQMTGREFKAGDAYTFELLRNNEVIDTTTIRPESGNSAVFALTDKSLDETDSKMTYTYEVREVNGGQTIGGVTYDSRSYKAEYRIVDNADGTVRAERVGGADLETVVFTNEYRTGGAAFTINGSKHMTGRSFRAGDEFTFTAAKDGQTYDRITIKPESGNDAAFAFKADAYTMADAGKTYKYTVYEEKGTISNVTYSDAVYEIEVTVTDDGTGNLNVSAVAGGDVFKNVEFVNSYSAPGVDDNPSGGGGNGDGNPDSNRPFVPGGPGDTTVTINPEEVPLANLPVDGSPTDNLILIDDGNVPLAGLPKTGDRAAHAGLAALLSGILLAAFTALSNRKREDENK